MENTLVRSDPCPECGGMMLWTQNAWHADGVHVAAYRCQAGHLVDPATTRQCPACGVHDTRMTAGDGAGGQFTCGRCGRAFAGPRGPREGAAG